MSQKVIVTDLNRCTGCLACMVACKAYNEVDLAQYWTRMMRIGPTPKYEGAVPPDVEMYFLPVGCQHCANPECVSVCPTGASQKLEDGTVVIETELCIGCQACIPACPYGVRTLNQGKYVVEKCTLCQDKIEQGGLPACVQQCGGRARFYGDIDEGIENLEGPGNEAAIGEDKSYENCDASRVKLGEYVEPFEQSDIYRFKDSGNDPQFMYILRNRTWQDVM